MGNRLKLLTTPCRVTLNAANLASTKIWFGSTSIISTGSILLLPRLNRILICLGRRTRAIVDIICGDREGGHRSSREELGFVVKKPFVKLSNGGRSITPFHLINDGFVVVSETFKYVFNLVFMVNDFPKKRNLIESDR